MAVLPNGARRLLLSVRTAGSGKSCLLARLRTATQRAGLACPGVARGTPQDIPCKTRGMPLVALTGGIASGKSTISARLAGATARSSSTPTRVVRELQQPGHARAARDRGGVRRAPAAARRLARPRGARRRRVRRRPRPSPAQRHRASRGLRRVGPPVRGGAAMRTRERSWSTTCRCSSRRGPTTPGTSWWSRTRPRRCACGGSSSCGG